MIAEASAASSYNLKAKFDYFNELCFENVLPNIPLSFSQLKTAAGKCSCKFETPAHLINAPKRIRAKNGILVPGSVRITIDEMFARDEQTIDGILIHEMIHAAFYFAGLLGEGHGRRFEAMRRNIEKIVGFSIPVTEDIKGLEIANLEIKRFIVLLREKSDGRYSYALTNATSYFKIATKLSQEWTERGYPGEHLKVYDIKSEVWTKLSTKMPVQRATKLSSIKFYLPGSFVDLIPDLLANGKLLADIEGRPR